MVGEPAYSLGGAETAGDELVAGRVSLVPTAPHVCGVQLSAGADEEGSSAAEASARTVAPAVAPDEDSDAGRGRPCCRGAPASSVATSATKSSANCACRETPPFSSEPSSCNARYAPARCAVGGWADYP